ncbi:hypothetical protein [Paludisphaera mucosa]|uniref:Glycosyltransferase RgtA/B/C/D-like domain-containing protein n=1 Tax=Paludisphaera mucosa TaxID=3030827 RepID=A0ABT6FL65_9BACT|nr:hypothetical protein [Paludisphaera mucosa]MDG3008297.1 hypothetical protein [Paludisphaera mucosa]
MHEHLSLRGCLITALLSLAMVVVTAGGWYGQRDPFRFDPVLALLDEHAAVRGADLESPSAHQFLLHAFRWSSGEWLSGPILFATFVVFCTAAGKRLGKLRMVALALAAIYGGAYTRRPSTGRTATEPGLNS